MATMESLKKAHFVGKWQENTFSDEILKNIAAHARAEKGKKVKIIMNKEGVKFVKPRIFKDDVVEFHPLKNIKTVTKNIRCDYCVMFILADEVKKYQIIAIRCDSDADAIYITNFFNQFRQNKPYGNIELRKRSDNGNWTLRDRSAHNASLHLKEVFKEQQLQRLKSNEDHNGNVIMSGSATLPKKNQNGILKQTSRESESTFPYTDVQTGTTTSERKAGQITTFSKGGNLNDDVQALVDHSQVADRVAHVDVRRGMTLLADKPKIQNGRMYATGGHTLGGRRVSGDLALYKQYQPHRATPGRSSMVVKMDPAYTINGSAGRHRTTSLRIPSTTNAQKLSTRSTIHRSIEETYAKPVIVQNTGEASFAQPIIVQQRARRGSGNSVLLSRQPRPQSVHVMGDNRLFVLQNGNTLKF